MCKYSGVDESNCGQILRREIEQEDEKDAIVAKHNELRRRVAKGEETGGINSPQPGASNMKKLVRTTPCNDTAVSFPAPGLERGAGGHRSEMGGPVHARP